MRTSPIDSSTRSLVPWARRWFITVVALSMADCPRPGAARTGATRPAARSATARSRTAPDSSYITTRRQAGDFALVSKRLAAPIVVSADTTRERYARLMTSERTSNGSPACSLRLARRGAERP